MSWKELTNRRNPRSRTYQNSKDSSKMCWSGVLTPLHYESILDSGVHDADVDMTPKRITAGGSDVWRITKNGWHYALGKPTGKASDGWVGFGGRQGQNWLKFRLERMGYLHWPTRSFEDVGGVPSYERSNLSHQTGTLTIGPNGDEVKASGIVDWSNIWNTPSSPQRGEVSVKWVANGDRLKEHIIVNKAAREWIRSNAPPSTPLNKTYFGFVFQVDWSDIPKIVRGGVLQNREGDFPDDGKSVELKDTSDLIIGSLPLSDVVVLDSLGLEVDRRPLRKRFYKDGNNHYLLVGIRCDILSGMEEGDLVFDPTVDKQVDVSGNDGRTRTGSTSFSNTAVASYLGHVDNASYLNCELFARFTGVTIEGTIDVSYIELWQFDYTSGSPTLKVYGIDEDNPDAPTSYAEFYADALTDESVDWDSGFDRNQWDQSPSLNAIFQELVDAYTISNDAVMVQVRHDGGAGATNAIYIRHYDYDDNTLGPKLHIEYSVAGGPAGVKTINDLAIASVKTINDVAIALVKTINDAS